MLRAPSRRPNSCGRPRNPFPPPPGSFLESAAGTAQSVALANVVLELVAAKVVHGSEEPFVRRAAVLAAAQVGSLGNGGSGTAGTCGLGGRLLQTNASNEGMRDRELVRSALQSVTSLPTASMARAMLSSAAPSEGGAAGLADDAALLARLEWAAGWLEHTTHADGDESVRAMARSAVHLHASAAAAGAAELERERERAMEEGVWGGRLRLPGSQRTSHPDAIAIRVAPALTTHRVVTPVVQLPPVHDA